MKKQKALFLAVTLGLTTAAGVCLQADPAQAATGDKTYVVIFNQESGLPSGYDSAITAAGGKVSRTLPQLGAVEVVSNRTDFTANLQTSSFVQDVSVENHLYPDVLPGSVTKLNSTESSKAKSDFSTHDLYNEFQWDIKQINGNGAAWKFPGGTGKSVDGKDIVVAVMDTGIDYNHPDIKGNYLYGKSFVPGEPDPIDESGHGTHVAGAIAGNGRVLGVGPDLKLASYRVFGSFGGGATVDIATAIRTAADDNVDVINMSFGGYDWIQDPSSTPKDMKADVKLFERAINYAVKKGVTVVGSAGNEGADLQSPGRLTKELYGPDAHGATFRIPWSKDLIAVSATGEELNRAYYSNYGKGMITLSAPGGDYGTAWMQDYNWDLMDPYKRCLSTVPGGGYAWMMGTSMASPKAAALAGLIIAHYGKDVLAPAKVRDIMEKSATDLGAKGYDGEFGYGLINAVKALK
ncbi:S8 family serine peptidase [Tumebacillus flagellatus]|uniref:Peptidase S8/S53 domain-containing protein n=1 Tax=Tumebacillus flagellatus TaxID=1157490 RepID=A0A074LRM4_9BACL|nr:S8 family serine peptidase [Tumebacillus flagellatus]KEO83759.1 hypothetical protein EL26_08910 [Tumebacillus flagellatus]